MLYFSAFFFFWQKTLRNNKYTVQKLVDKILEVSKSLETALPKVNRHRSAGTRDNFGKADFKKKCTGNGDRYDGVISQRQNNQEKALERKTLGGKRKK